MFEDVDPYGFADVLARAFDGEDADAGARGVVAEAAVEVSGQLDGFFAEGGAFDFEAGLGLSVAAQEGLQAEGFMHGAAVEGGVPIGVVLQVVQLDEFDQFHGDSL